MKIIKLSTLILSLSFSNISHSLPTEGTDVISFLGTLQNITINLTSPTGIAISRTGEYRVNSTTYDGLGGTDFLIMGNDGDYLQSGISQNIEQYIAGSGEDFIDLSAHNTNLTIALGRDNDVAFGGSGVDTIYGAQGDDFIDGGAGNDVLAGNNGNDTVYGGLGNDLIKFGHGMDIVIGGEGLDVFANDAFDTEIDTIVDFTTGDYLNVTSILSGYDSGVDDITDFVIFTQQGSDTLVSINILGVGDLSDYVQGILLQNVQADQIVTYAFNEIDSSIVLGDVVGDFPIYGLANVTAVPVPAAVWLFVSGLISLVSMRAKPKHR